MKYRTLFDLDTISNAIMYKGKYRARRPLAARTIDATPYAQGDTALIYFGISDDTRLTPDKVVNG